MILHYCNPKNKQTAWQIREVTLIENGWQNWIFRTYMFTVKKNVKLFSVDD